MIYILGDGVAARVLHHFLVEKGTHHKLIVSGDAPKVNNISGGVRYLDQPFDQPVYESMLGEMNIAEMDGGVVVDEQLLLWKDIFANEAYKHYVTGRYAIEKGRKWSPTIMNNLFNRTEPQSYVGNYSYQTFLDDLNPIAAEDILRVVSIDTVLTDTKKMVVQMGETEHTMVEYEHLISTLPINVLMGFLGKSEIEMKMSFNREFTQETSCAKDQMWYILGHGRIKRISIISGLLKIEASKNPLLNFKDDYIDILHGHSLINLLSTLRLGEVFLQFDKWNIKDLPPNFSVDESAVSYSLNGLDDVGVHCLGRFAQAKPKMMMGDIVEEANTISNYISTF